VTSRKTILVFVGAALLLLLAACGSSEPSSVGNEPLAAQDNFDETTYTLEWDSGDDADPLISDWEYENLRFDVEDTEGNSLSTSEATGCFIDSLDPSISGEIDRGQEFTVVVDCSQVYWEDRRGTAWEEFSDAYAEGYSEGCENVFDLSPNGSLYLDDWEYSWVDCPSAGPYEAEDSDGVPYEVPDLPDLIGTEVGEHDGCIAFFDSVGGVLFYGPNAVDSSVCESGTSGGGIVVDAVSTMGFESPTGNIRCSYDSTRDEIVCFVASLGQAVSLDANGIATKLGNSPIGRQNQVVQYGSVWTQSVFTCESSANGIICAANVGNFGGYFAVSREGIVARSD
jgi:hypothetical protein